MLHMMGSSLRALRLGPFHVRPPHVFVRSSSVVSLGCLVLVEVTGGGRWRDCCVVVGTVDLGGGSYACLFLLEYILGERRVYQLHGD